MPLFAWEGRSRTGSQERGILEAPTKDAALQELRSRGVLVIRLQLASDADKGMSGPIDEAPVAPPTVVRHRDGASLRDKLFYIGVVAVFTMGSVGLAYFAPFLTLDCARDAKGDVSCEVHRRLYGFIPLSDLRLSRIVSVTLVESVHEPGLAESSESPTGFEALALACADGASWQSHNSSSPLGRSMSQLQDGIRELLDAQEPRHYHGWTAEKVPLLVASVFLLPAGLILFALLVKLAVPRAIVERKIAAIEADAARRASERQRWKP